MNIVSIYSNLLVLSNRENEITLQNFTEIIQKFCSSISSSDAEIYMISYILLANDNIEEVISLFSLPEPLKKKRLTANVKGLAIFLFLQLYSSNIFRHSLNFNESGKKPKDFNINFSSLSNSQFNESIKGGIGGHAFSPLNSPRSKTTRLFYFSSEQQQIYHYIKNNISTMLKFLSNDLSKDEVFLKIQDVKILSFLFNSGNAEISFEKLINQTFNKSIIQLNVFSEWISSNLVNSEQNHSI